MTISSHELDQMQARLRGERVGRTNRSNTGKSFEAQIQKSIDEYHRLGVLWAHKVDPPVRMVGKRVIFLRNPFLDFSGCYTADKGRALFFEAKSTAGHLLPLGSKGGITLQQIQTMRTLSKAGAAVFVLWRSGQRDTYFISGSVVCSLWDRGRKSLQRDDCWPIDLSVGVIQVPFEQVMKMAGV